MNPQQIGSLFLELTLNANKYYADLQKAQEHAVIAGKEIEKNLQVFKNSTLKTRVDDRELTALNKHLDKKVVHYKQTQIYFTKNPLKIKINADKTDLNKIDQVVLGSDNRQNVKPKNNQEKLLMEDTGKELDKIGDRLVKSIQKATKNGSFLSSIFTGATEGLGRQLSQGFNEGFSGALNQVIGKRIGSFELLGRSIIEKGIPGVLNTIKKSNVANKGLDYIKKNSIGQASEQSLQAIKGFIGAEEVALEQRRIASTRKAAKQSRNEIAAKELGIEYQDILVKEPIKQIKFKQIKSEIERLKKESVQSKALISKISSSSSEQVAEEFLTKQISAITNQLQANNKSITSVSAELEITFDDENRKILESRLSSLKKQQTTLKTGQSQAKNKQARFNKYKGASAAKLNSLQQAELTSIAREQESIKNSSLEEALSSDRSTEDRIKALSEQLKNNNEEKEELEKLLEYAGVSLKSVYQQRAIKTLRTPKIQEKTQKLIQAEIDKINKSKNVIDKVDKRIASLLEILDLAQKNNRGNKEIALIQSKLDSEKNNKGYLLKIIEDSKKNILGLEKGQENLFSRLEGDVFSAETFVVKQATKQQISPEDISQSISIDRLKQLGETQKEALEKFQNLEFESKAEAEALLKQISEINKNVPKYEKQAEEAIKAAQESKKKSLSVRADTVNVQGSVNSSKAAQVKKKVPHAYRDILKEVAQRSGVNIAEEDIPDIKAFSKKQIDSLQERLGGVPNAGYVANKNKILLRPEQYKQLMDDKLTPELVEQLTHELRHAVQSDFGKISSEETRSNIDLIRPEKKDYENFPELAQRIEGSTNNSKGSSLEFQQHLRATEQDAYMFQARNSPQIYQKALRSANIRSIEQSFGSGGGKLKNTFAELQKMQYDRIASFLEASNYDPSTAVTKLDTKIAAIKTVIDKQSSILENIDSLSDEEIQQYADRAAATVNLLTSKISKIAEEVDSELKELSLKEVESQLLGGATNKEQLINLSKKYGLSASGTKKELTQSLLKNVSLAELRSSLPPMSKEQQEAIATTQKASYPFEELTKNIKEKNITSLSLEQLKTDYALVLELLNQTLRIDIANTLEAAKLNIAKEIKSRRPVESNAINIEDSDTDIQLQVGLKAIKENIETARLKALAVIQNIKTETQKAATSNFNKNSQKQGQGAVNRASKSLLEVDEEIFKQQSSDIDNAIEQITQEIESIYKNIELDIESKLLHYQSILQKADEDISNITEKNIQATLAESQEIEKSNRKLLNKQERLGGEIDYTPLRAPKEYQGKTLAGDISKSIQSFFKDINEAVKTSTLKRSAVVLRESGAMSADLLSSSEYFKQQGNFEEVDELLNYRNKLEKAALELKDFLSKPASALSKEDISQIQQLNKEISQIYETFDRSIDPPALPDSFLESLINAASSAKGLTNALLTLGKAGLAFVGFQKIVDVFKDFIPLALGVATEFENIERQIKFSSSSVSEGSQNISFLREQAKNLKTDLRTTLESGSGIIAASRETALEGEPTKQILGAVTQASSVYGLAPEKQQRAFLAIEQQISKGIVNSEELRQQLGEALPGAFNIAARAIGVTTIQLNKMLKQGQILSETFLPKFAQQLSVETSSGLSGIANTSQGAINSFNNSIIEFQEKIGKAFLPLQNFSLNAMSSALQGIIALMPQIITGFQFLAIYATKPIWTPFINGLLSTIATLKVSQISMSGIGSTLNTIKSVAATTLKAVSPLLIEFLAFQSVITIFDNVKKLFADFGEDFRESANEMQKALKDIDESFTKIDGKKRNSSIFSNLGNIVKTSALEAVGLSAERDERIKALDKRQAIDDNIKNVSGLIDRAKSPIINTDIKKIQTLDEDLENVQIKRRALIAINPADKKTLENLKSQETNILKERENRVKNVAKIQLGLQKAIEFYNKSIEEINKQKLEGFIDDFQYEQQINVLNQGLDEAKQKQEELNKLVGKGTTAFDNLQQSIAKVADELADTLDKITISNNVSKTALFRQIASGQITPGQEQIVSRNIDQNAIKEQMKAQASAIIQTSALLDTSDNKNRLKAYGVNENTGSSRLKTLANYAGQEQDIQGKYALEQAASLQEQRIKLSDLNNQLAQSKADAQKQMVDLTKQVADYYRGIERQAAEQAIEISRLESQIQASSQQNKLRKVLTDGYDDIVSTFIDGIISLIDEQKQISDRALDAQSQLLNNRTELEDTLRSGVELQRQLPGNLPKIPIELNLSGIKNNASINELKNSINEAIDNTSELTNNINNANNSWKDSNNIVDGLNDNINSATNEAAKAYEQLFKAENSLNNSASLSNKWADSLLPIKEQAIGIGNIFSGISKNIESAIASTGQWAAQLIKGAQQAGNSLIEIGTSDPVNKPNAFGMVGNLAQNILNAGKFGYASPSSKQSWQQVLNGSVSSMQSFFAPRPRRNGTHHGIDFDGTEGLGGNAPVQAMFPGTVKTTKAWGSGASDPVSGASNAIRIESPLPRGLGNFVTEYGHLSMKANQVKEGQTIGAGQAIGKTSNNDSFSQGGHLDIKIKIPSNIAGQFKNTASGGKGMHFVDVKEFMKWYQLQVDAMPKGVTNSSLSSQQSRSATNQSGESTKLENKVVSRFAGKASFYGGGDGFDGKPTASGEKFNANQLTAAHKTLPFGTIVKVINPENNKTVVVRINDRGPYSGNRILDLSKAAARQLDFVNKGVADIQAEVLAGKAPKGEKGNAVIRAANAGRSVLVQENLTSTRTLLTDNIKNLQSYIVRDLQTDKDIARQNVNQPPASSASSIKLIIADLVSQAVKNNKLSASQTLKIQQNDVAQYSDLKAGSQTTIVEAVHRMLKDSDNTSTNILISALGGTKAIAPSIQKKYPNSRVANRLSVPNDYKTALPNKTTALDVTNAMSNLFKDNSEIGKVAQNALLSTRNFKYKGEIGGKIANNGKVVGNVGLADINGKKYIITAFANANGNSQQGKNIITKGTNDIINTLNPRQPTRSQSAPLPQDRAISTSEIKRGGNELSPAEMAKLTPLGKELYQYRNHPSILAIGDVVARAEGTDFRQNSKNFGYGMLIGGENITNFRTHPFVGTGRSPRHNSTASGRYQMMNFNYSSSLAAKQFGRGAKSDLSEIFTGEQAPSFSPGVQDLYFIASLKKRGVLDEALSGDLTGVLNKSGINSLAAHYASLENKNGQGYYRGQKTPEGMRKNSILFANARLKDRIVNAANSGQSISPGEMRSGVIAGQDLARSTSNERSALIQTQLKIDTERQQLEFIRKQEQQLRQFEKAGRDLEDQRRSGQREVTDLANDAIRNPSPDQRRKTESTQIFRRYDDAVRDRQRQIEETQRRISKSEAGLTSGEITGENANALQKQMLADKSAVQGLSQEIIRLQDLKLKAEREFTQIFNREEAQRRQQADFAKTRAEIEKMQLAIEALNLIQQQSPLDPRVAEIPKLQENLEITQALLNADEKRADLNDQLFKFDITPEEYSAQIKLLDQETIARQENALAKKEQTIAEQDLQNIMRNNEVRSQINQLNSETLQSQLQLRQLGKRIGRDTPDIQKEIDSSSAQNDYIQRKLEIQQNKNRTSEEKTILLKAADDNQSVRMQVIEAQYDRSTEDDRINVKEKLNQSRQEVGNSQSSFLRNLGFETQAKEIDKRNAIASQNISYESAIREIEQFAATSNEAALAAVEMRTNLEQVNQVKLADINAQFNPVLEGVKTLQGATEGLFSDLLSGTDGALASFGKKILDYFTQLAAQMLTNDLFSGILGGDLLGGSKKQNPTNDILGSVLGGLLGGGGSKAAPSNGGGDIYGQIFGSLVGGLFYDGGYKPKPIPNFAKGYNPIQQAFQKERMMTGRKPYLAVLSEGERVLNLNETQKFNEIGGERLIRMADGGIVGGSVPNTAIGQTNNVSVSNNITIQGNGENTDIASFRQVLDGRIREIIRDEQRPGRSLNKKNR